MRAHETSPSAPESGAPRADADRTAERPVSAAASCIFCRIVAGTAPAFIVWEDDEHVAFLDTQPVAAGHVLLVPRTHVDSVDALDASAHARLFARVRALSRPVAAAAGVSRAGLVVEGFGVAHAHVHLVPIRKAGDLDPTRARPATAADLGRAADRLRAALASGR